MAQGEDRESSKPTVRARPIATKADMDKLVSRLQVNAKAVNAEVSELYVTQDPTRGFIGCWMVRWTPKNAEEIVEVRVAVVGNVDAGKSTMLGTVFGATRFPALVSYCHIATQVS
jgi:GTPase